MIARMLAVQTKPVETLLFQSELVAIGKFRCEVDHPLYRNSGPCPEHTIVFPRTMTAIRHERGPSFAGTPNSISFYNRDQIYFRDAISAVDASDWYVVDEAVLLGTIASIEPRSAEHPQRPFPFASGPSPAALYLMQRRLFESLERGEAIEPSEVEERVLHIAASSIEAALGRRARLSKEMRDVVEETKRRIARAPQRNPSLGELAAAAVVSPFQLCRAFTTFAGMTITAFRHSLRLRMALERLHDAVDLTDLSLELGYSSHSHFTSFFRRQFGVTPSAWSQEHDSGASVSALRLKA